MRKGLLAAWLYGMTTNQKALRNLGIVVLLFAALYLFICWTDARHPTPTPSQRAEAWRLEKLEKARIKNYLETIKPHVPVE